MIPIDVVNNLSDRDIALGKMYRVDRFLLHVGQWRKFSHCLPNPVKWKTIKFTTANVKKLPRDARGVYTFVAKPEAANHPACAYLLYVGKADDTTFRVRYSSYLTEHRKRKPRQHIVSMVKNWHEYLWFYYTPITDKAAIDPFEEALVAALIPPFNRNFSATIKRWVAGVFS